MGKAQDKRSQQRKPGGRGLKAHYIAAPTQYQQSPQDDQKPKRAAQGVAANTGCINHQEFGIIALGQRIG